MRALRHEVISSGSRLRLGIGLRLELWGARKSGALFVLPRVVFTIFLFSFNRTLLQPYALFSRKEKQKDRMESSSAFDVTMQASLEEEAKRLMPAIKHRKQLMQRHWDGVPATAAAFGLKGEAGLFNAVVKSAEKGCRGAVTLRGLRRLKASYEVPGEGGDRVVKTAVRRRRRPKEGCFNATGWRRARGQERNQGQEREWTCPYCVGRSDLRWEDDRPGREARRRYEEEEGQDRRTRKGAL